MELLLAEQVRGEPAARWPAEVQWELFATTGSPPEAREGETRVEKDSDCGAS